MSPRLHFYILTLFLILIFSPLGMSFIDGKQAENAHKADSFERSMAVITEAIEVSKRGEGKSIIYYYQFTAADGIRYTGSGTMILEEWKINNGTLPIEIYYDPNNPNTNSPAAFVDLYADKRPLSLRLFLGATIAAPFAVAIAAVWSWFGSLRRKKVQRYNL